MHAQPLVTSETPLAVMEAFTVATQTIQFLSAATLISAILVKVSRDMMLRNHVSISFPAHTDNCIRCFHNRPSPSPLDPLPVDCCW